MDEFPARSNDAPALTMADVLAAREAIRGHVVETPLVTSRTLSSIAGCELVLKFENLQFTGSFKERGALNRLLQLSDTQRAKGVIAASAGNHAQGVAYHARRLGVPVVIVMPRFAPFVKIENTERLGAEVVLAGDSFDDARVRMAELAQARGLTIVHPYDDPAIIAGQGTLGIEILEARPDLDCLVVPIGGGGLIAGLALAARTLKPGVEIVGVQAERFPGAWNAYYHRVAPDFGAGPTIAEGIAVEHPGRLTLPLIRSNVDSIELVTEVAIENAVVTLLEIEKTVAEGAGAAGLAEVLSRPARYAGRKVGLVLTGGNIDPLTLAELIARQLVRTHRMVRLQVSARDAPGSLARIATIIADQGANIEEVTHQRAFASLPVRYTRIDVVVSTRGQAHLERLVAELRAAGFDCEASESA